MFEKHVTSHQATADDQELAAAVRAHERARYDHSPNISAEDLIAYAAEPGNVVEVNGNTISYADKRPALSLQIGAADPAGHIVAEQVAALERRADFHREQLQQLTDPATGLPRKGFEREHRVAVMQLRDLQVAAAYEQTVAASALRQRQSERDRSRYVELVDEDIAQDEAFEDATSKRFSDVFGPVKIR